MPKYNQQQLAAITHPQEPLLIIAGAGTGKTTTIVGRIAHLIQNEGIEPESILVLTFTNDAAEKVSLEFNDNGWKSFLADLISVLCTKTLLIFM